ncbi:MAG: hypothetical protein AB7V14_11490 [Kiritimatiellia bacterium]
MKKAWAILLAFLLPVLAHAYQFRTGQGTNSLALAAGEALDEETALAAYAVDVQGKAKGDLWLLASTSVRFGGQARDDLRVFSRSAFVGGEVRQNLLVYSAHLQLATSAVVRGQAALFGSRVVCEGAVEGDAWIFADSVTLGGIWGGDVKIRANDVRIVPGTQIAGKLVYASAQPLALDPSVSIAGGASPSAVPSANLPFPSRLAFHGYLFLAALLVGMPFVGFFPGFAGGAVRTLRTSPWRVLAAGAGTLLLAPFLVAFAFMTIVGIPLALLLGALFAALAYLSHVVVALWLGHAILRAPGPQTFARVLSALSLGLFLLYFAAALPGVASFLLLPVGILGTGALVLALFRRPVVVFPAPPPLPPPLPRNPEPTEPTE